MQNNLATYGSAVAIASFSDTTQVSCRAIWVGSAGNLAVKTTPGATAVTFIGVPAGTVLPISLDLGSVMSTNTTVAAAANVLLLS